MAATRAQVNDEPSIRDLATGHWDSSLGLARQRMRLADGLDLGGARPTIPARWPSSVRRGDRLAEHPSERLGNLFRQACPPCRLAESSFLTRGRGYRGPDPSAFPALHLTEAGNQPHTAARAAMIKLGRPIMGNLAVRADQHLPVMTYTPLPWAWPPVRINLPRTAAVAGHRQRSSAIGESRPPMRAAAVATPAPRVPSGTGRGRVPAGSDLRPSSARRRLCR